MLMQHPEVGTIQSLIVRSMHGTDGTEHPQGKQAASHSTHLNEAVRKLRERGTHLRDESLDL